MDLIVPGYNDLTFFVSQHYTLKGCEDPSAPELWTTVRLDKGYLEVDYRPKPVPLRLSAISDFLFDPKLFGLQRVNIVIDKLTEETMKWASIVASGVALRFDYREVAFSLSTDWQKGMDNIVVGKTDFVKRFLSSKGVKMKLAKGPFLGIASMDNGTHALIVVSGNNDSDVEVAAKTFASMSIPFPGTSTMEIKGLKLSEVKPYEGRLMLKPGRKYKFKYFGFSTRTFVGLNPVPAKLTFHLPAGLLIRPNEYATLYLHLVYGAGLRSDSALNLYLNGRFVSSIHLKNPEGEVYSNYKISIPTYLFKRGYNTITFKAVLTPSNTGYCKFIQTENLILTLFDDSSIYFPKMSYFVEMPRMELFFRDGFPFTVYPDGRETMIYLATPSLKVASAALNIIGLMTQKMGYPMFNLSFVLGSLKPWSGNVIVLGATRDVPEAIFKRAPLKLGKVNEVLYPLLNSPSGEKVKEKGLFDRLLSTFGVEKTKRITFNATLPFMAESQQVSGLGTSALLMEFQSPFKEGRTVLLGMADSEDAVYRLGLSLLDAGVQGKIIGDLAFLELSGAKVRLVSTSLASKYYVGKLGKAGKVDFYIHTYFWLYLAVLATVLLVFVFSAYQLLKRHRRKKLEQ